MRAVARAQPNIALIKYWGKRDSERNLPAVGSISVTLDELFTRMSVQLSDSPGADTLTVNGEPSAKMLPRISRCIDRVLGENRPAANVASDCNFPIAAGLASSASAFAAAVIATAAAAGREFSSAELASLAGAASGSAARSLYGGFVELENSDDDDISVSSLAAPDDWPLSVVVAITSSDSKPLGSGEAMERSRETSPFYANWVSNQGVDLDAARTAIAERDFRSLATVAEHNCLKMHSVMWASRPAIVYWNSATLNCLQTIRALQADGVDVFFTIDAGPQVKAICAPGAEADVRAALDAADGVQATMRSGLGPGAVVEQAA